MASNLRHIATEPANLNHKVMNAERKMQPRPRSHLHASDSDVSVETASLSQESQPSRSPSKLSPGVMTTSSRHSKSFKGEWEILEGLRDGQRHEARPPKHEGHLLKKRKWPMKGWHKRFFVLENGTLRYAKTSTDMAKGKLHGEVDVGLSVISTKLRGRRIDIDAEESIYHLKVKPRETFPVWVEHLKRHRLFRQHEISFGHPESKINLPTSEVSPPLSPVNSCPQMKSRDSTSHTVRSPSFHCRSRVAAWLAESAVLDKFNKDLLETQKGVFQLGNLIEQLEDLNSSAAEVNKTSTVSLNIEQLTPLSTSNPNLPSLGSNHLIGLSDCSNLYPPTLLAQKGHEKELRDEFFVTSKDVLALLRNLIRTVQIEKDRLKQSLEFENLTLSSNSSSSVVTSLRSSLSQALQQNADLRSRLSKIHSESELSEFSVSPDSARVTQQQSASYESSSAVSVSEYFDAAEYMAVTDSSSEASLSDEEEGSFTSDNSETGTDCTPARSMSDSQSILPCTTGRRTKLPVPKPEVGDFNLWNLLCRNIGKDLSKISMPVTLNEPLNTLQRLCEELEYSELLDKAAETQDPYERMVLIAAFAVSAYGSSYYRAAHKPFNPLLGETYECIREDRGFRFIAEQVCHHPPISVCHAESKNFIFWQDLRIKTTFWGKSMEVQPIGTVHLILPKFDEHYRWNKVTSCIHNLFGGQRWVDLFGELCISSSSAKCKLTFAKASYWSNKRHEVVGNVINKDGKVAYNLFGKWNEALYCGVAPSARCVWRIGAMPEDSEIYYGFTRFAIELNELEPEMSKFLPPSDSRFRPDQRLLEEGNVQLAEASKVQLEQSQRDRKKKREDDGLVYEPMWFKKATNTDGKESWEFTGDYWAKRANPGFVNIKFPHQLW